MQDVIHEILADFEQVFNAFQKRCQAELLAISLEITSCLQAGNKLLICGNGGSAADSQHLAAEFVSSFSRGLKRKSLPAISLTSNASIITAFSNDFNFEQVFARQVEGLGKVGDLLLTISTSGQSKNCLAAVDTAKQMGLLTASLTRYPSELYELSDFALGVPSNNTQHIQECHIISYHIIAEIVERIFMETS